MGKSQNDFKVIVACQGGEECKNSHLYIGYDKCSHSALVCGGDKVCKSGCLGYGDCEAKCPHDAIIMDNEVAYIDQNLCTSCGKCVNVCSKNVIKQVPKDSKVYVACNQNCAKVLLEDCLKACTACGKCKKVCPHKAITVKRGKVASIDYSKCTGCLMCLDACPQGVIKRI